MLSDFITGDSTIWLSSMIILSSMSPWVILKLIESKKWFYLTIYILIILLLFIFIGKVQESKAEEERKAYWDNYNSQTFIITFDTDGGQPIESMEVHPNTYLSPVIPYKAGYEFTNWTLNGTVFNFSGYVNSRITSNVTLKANYVKSNTSNNSNSSNSGSYNNSYNSTSYGYQKIYNEYSQKLVNAGPTSSITEMANILAEGTTKMAQYMYSAKGTDGQYATYQSWVDKLYNVYMNNCR